MASMWRRAMLYLGLGPDDEYDDYDSDDEAIRRRLPPTAALAPRGHRRSRERRAVGDRGVRRSVPATAGRRAIRAVTTRPRPRSSGRSRCRRRKPHVVVPTSFNHAQEVADKLQGQPAGDRQPPGRRPRPLPTAHRLRQRPLLRPRRADGAGGQPGVPAHPHQRGGLGRGAPPPPRARDLRLADLTLTVDVICLVLNLYVLILLARSSSVVPGQPGTAVASINVSSASPSRSWAPSAGRSPAPDGRDRPRPVTDHRHRGDQILQPHL